MKKKSIFIGLLASASLILGACGDDTAADSKEKNVLKTDRAREFLERVL